MNEMEQEIMEIIRTKPNGISSSEIESHFPKKDCGLVLNRLHSLWKFKFIDRSKTKITCRKGRCNVVQYLWRIHRVDKRIWTADMMVLIEGETDMQYKQRMLELLKQNEQMEIWT